MPIFYNSRKKFQLTSVSGSFEDSVSYDNHRFFRARLFAMIDLRRPSCAGYTHATEAYRIILGAYFSHRNRPGWTAVASDLQGPIIILAGAGISMASSHDCRSALWLPFFRSSTATTWTTKLSLKTGESYCTLNSSAARSGDVLNFVFTVKW